MTKPQIYTAHQPRELINSAILWLEQGHKIAMLTLVAIDGNAPYPIGSQMLVCDDGEFLGHITGGCAETALVQQALFAIAKSENITERYGLNSRFFDIKLPCGSGLDIEFDVTSDLSAYQSIAVALDIRKAVKVSDVKTYYPSQRILLFGQGPILISFIELATRSGFDVMHFESNHSYDVLSYCDQYTGLVSLFHEHELEIDTLVSVLGKGLFYIGALGSQRTHAARLVKLSEKGVPDSLVKEINGPIGLDIGAATPSQIAVIILAAGQSTRFGSIKMNYPIEESKTILSVCFEKYQSRFTNMNIVVSTQVELDKIVIKGDTEIIASNNSVKGMSQSLIAGIQAQPNSRAWLIALGDMPYVQIQTIEKLAAKATTDNIVVPVFDNKRGNPVIFGQRFYDDLMKLDGDVGAKELINSNRDLVCEVDVTDIGVLLDIDRIEDIQ